MFLLCVSYVVFVDLLRIKFLIFFLIVELYFLYYLFFYEVIKMIWNLNYIIILLFVFKYNLICGIMWFVGLNLKIRIY